MSQTIGGERGVSPVASKRGPWLTKGQTRAAILLGTTAIIGFIFWRSDRHHTAPPDPRSGITSIAQLVPYDPPRPPPEPPRLVPQEAPPPPPPPQDQPLPEPHGFHPFTQLRATVAPKEPRPAMISYGSVSNAAASSGGTQAPTGSGETKVAFKGAEIPGGKSGNLGNTNLMLMPGIIRCTLDSAIDSTLPGPIMCHLPEDVRSPTGAVVLMEKGTRVIGEYKSNVQQGQGRLFTLAATAYTPNGVVVPIDGPMADGLGRTGLQGDVDNHLMQRFGGAVMLSLANSALSIAQASVSRGNQTSFNFQSGDMTSLAQEVLRGTINIPPTIQVNQGQEVSIWIRYPIDFSASYRLVPR